MIPVKFPEANSSFGPPPDLDASQCRRVPAFNGQITGGSLDGARIIVTAWEPSQDDLIAIQAGSPIFLCFIGELPPHFATTSFKEAVNVA